MTMTADEAKDLAEAMIPTLPPGEWMIKYKRGGGYPNWKDDTDDGDNSFDIALNTATHTLYTLEVPGIGIRWCARWHMGGVWVYSTAIEANFATPALAMTALKAAMFLKIGVLEGQVVAIQNAIVDLRE
jgi:hypothetical protein